MMETDTAGFEAADQHPQPPRDVAVPGVPGRPHRHPDGHRPGDQFALLAGPDGSFLPGTNEFLTKPVDIDELLAKIGRALK